jgi:hypothetical protein
MAQAPHIAATVALESLTPNRSAMRKIVVLANALLKAQSPWTPKTA